MAAMKHCKKRIGIVIVSIMTFITITSMAVIKLWSQEEDSKKVSLQNLSTKSGAECIEILEEAGLVLPESYQMDHELAEETVKMIIDSMAAKEWRSDAIAYNYTELAELTRQIHEIVEKYE